MLVEDAVLEVGGAEPLQGGLSGGSFASFSKLDGRLARLRNSKHRFNCHVQKEFEFLIGL